MSRGPVHAKERFAPVRSCRGLCAFCYFEVYSCATFQYFGVFIL